jgi:hypothetical protein
MTFKEWLDSIWSQRLQRLVIYSLPIMISGGGGVIGWFVYQNYTTASRAEEAASKAVELAAKVQDVQDERADLSDQRAIDEKAWRERFDRSLTSVNQRISVLIDQVGQLKGIVIREGSIEELPWGITHPAELLSSREIDVAGDFSQEDR